MPQGPAGPRARAHRPTTEVPRAHLEGRQAGVLRRLGAHGQRGRRFGRPLRHCGRRARRARPCGKELGPAAAVSSKPHLHSFNQEQREGGEQTGVVPRRRRRTQHARRAEGPAAAPCCPNPGPAGRLLGAFWIYTKVREALLRCSRWCGCSPAASAVRRPVGTIARRDPCTPLSRTPQLWQRHTQ